MALWIIKESFRELFKNFRYYIFPCIISLFVEIVNYFLPTSIPFSKFFLLFFSYLIELPIFIIFYEKNLLSRFRDQKNSFLLSATIYSCFSLLLDYIFGVLKIHAEIFTYRNSMVFFHFLSLIFSIELIQSNVNPLRAMLNILKICSRITLKDLWLLIKLFFLEEFIYLSFCVLCFLALLAAPIPAISQVLKANAYFIFLIVAHIFIYPYSSIRTCFYYDIISLNNKTRTRE